jgi:hypothetical protein
MLIIYLNKGEIFFYLTQSDDNDVIGFVRTAETDKRSRGTTPYLWIVDTSDNIFRKSWCNL